MSLELGGKNPMIVCADANLDKFLDIAVRSCFTSAGQLCVSTERMFIAHEIYPQFVSALVERTRALTLGASIGWGYEVGSLTTAAHAERVQAAIQRAVDEGAHVETGGRLRTDIGPLVYEPTVLTGVSPTMSVAIDEVFGPCVVVTPFDSIDEAIAMANDSDYGLSASVITSDLVSGERIAEKIKCGSVNVNESYAAAFGSISSPMGGMGQSGYGRRHGDEGILRFTEPQTIAIQRGLTISPHFGRTDSQWASVMTKALNLMKKLWIR
jgi:acyl-CoA reductase-like NAD-dependent aldehyde dehydrogenase